MDEVLDIAFNTTGTRLATASADGTARIYNVYDSACIAILQGSLFMLKNRSIIINLIHLLNFWLIFLYFILIYCSGHEGEISKISFNPQGTKIITAGADNTARIWSAETGEEIQVLKGHTDEIFSCAFNYEGDTIITG